jgi:hypothetical protein
MLQAFENDVEELLEARRFDEAVRLAALAAEVACWRPSGTLWSKRLETAIDTAAATLPNASHHAGGRDASSRQGVLHVATELYQVGGHTRMIRNWIDGDSAVQSSLVVTGSHPIPLEMDALVATTGGTFARLSGPPLECAASLRAMAAKYALVVLGIHAYDVVACLAFGQGYEGPPVILVNHVDHLFWLAPSRTSLVASVRRSGHALTVASRGVPPGRCAVLPIPVAPPKLSFERDAKRAMLGLGSAAVLCLTMADSYKYRETAWRDDLFEALTSSLAKEPLLHLCAVGPTDADPPWDRLKTLYPERVVVLGRVPDPTSLLEAADLYLDSYPFPSVTSAVEAAFVGKPIITMCPEEDRASVISLDDPAFEEVAIVCSTSEELSDTLVTLCRKPSERERIGAAAKSAVLRVHSGSGWRDQLERCIRVAERCDASLLRLPAANDGIDDAARLAAIVYSHGKLQLRNRVLKDPSIRSIPGCASPWRRRLINQADNLELPTFMYLEAERVALSRR